MQCAGQEEQRGKIYKKIFSRVLLSDFAACGACEPKKRADAG